MNTTVYTRAKYACRSLLLLAAAVGACLPGLSFALDSKTGSVTLKGNVVAIPAPTCTYTLSSAVTMYNIPFDTIKEASTIESLLSSQITPGQISANGTLIKNTLASQIYKSTTLETYCSNLTKAFTIKAAPKSGACASAGCSYLRVSSSPAALNDILSLAVFSFAAVAGQVTSSAIWWDLNRTSGTVSGNGHSIINAAETAIAATSKTIEVGFLLVKKTALLGPPLLIREPMSSHLNLS